MSASAPGPSVLPALSSTASASGSNSNLASRTVVVILSSAVSVVGIFAVALLVFICCRLRQRRGGLFFPRSISPIDDDEIETWKGSRGRGRADKCDPAEGSLWPHSAHAERNHRTGSPPLLSAGVLGAGATVQRRGSPLSTQLYLEERGFGLDGSGGSVSGKADIETKPGPPPKRSPSNVIVYNSPPQPYPGMPDSASSACGLFRVPDFLKASTATIAGVSVINRFQQLQQQQQNVLLYRRSEEFSSRPSRPMPFGYPPSRGMAGRFSLDQGHDFLAPHGLVLPPTPTTAPQHARAPNSRTGLTDEAIPGDPSFLPTAKRQPSRLLKMPPAMGSPSVTAAATVATAMGGHGASAVFSPRRNLNSIGGGSEGNGTAFLLQTRTRGRRSCSSIGYAGSEVILNKSFDQPYRQSGSSDAQQQPVSPPQTLTPPRQSQTTALRLQLSGLPLLHISAGSGCKSDASGVARHPESHGGYDKYSHWKG